MNQDPSVDNIIIQLPLPNHLDKDELLNVIDPSKDVDGQRILIWVCYYVANPTLWHVPHKVLVD